MTDKEMFRIWTPAGKKWVDWVRPVPFVQINEYSKGYKFSNFSIPTINYLEENCKATAVIIDLPGAESVKEGIALAKAGFRPIPIFNGTIEQPGARATVDNQTVGVALMWGTLELEKINISDDAMPAFLLDSNRLHRFKMEESLFDNSWDVYPQDLPSAEYLLNNGIHKIVIVGEGVSKDLKKILYDFQKKKLEIYFTKGYETPKKIMIHRTFRKNR